MADIGLIYDPRYHTFESWACLMVEKFGAQNLEIPMYDTTWQGWAAGLKAIDIFANEATPDPYTYSDWSEWAQALVGIMNSGA